MPIWASPLLLIALIRLSLRELYPFRARAHPTQIKSRGAVALAGRAQRANAAARPQPAPNEHTERELALINARPEVRMDRSTRDDVLDAHLALEQSGNLSVWGIRAVAVVVCHAQCSTHGYFAIERDATLQEAWDPRVICPYDHDGATHRVPIIRTLTREENSFGV